MFRKQNWGREKQILMSRGYPCPPEEQPSPLQAGFCHPPRTHTWSLPCSSEWFCCTCQSRLAGEWCRCRSWHPLRERERETSVGVSVAGETLTNGHGEGIERGSAPPGRLLMKIKSELFGKSIFHFYLIRETGVVGNEGIEEHQEISCKKIGRMVKIGHIFLSIKTFNFHPLVTPSGKAKEISNWTNLGPWIITIDVTDFFILQKQIEWLFVCPRNTESGTRWGGSSGMCEGGWGMGAIRTENPAGECTRNWCLL